MEAKANTSIIPLMIFILQHGPIYNLTLYNYKAVSCQPAHVTGPFPCDRVGSEHVTTTKGWVLDL